MSFDAAGTSFEELEQEIIWAPLPGSQEQAVSCPCNDILYEGTRGPGKTEAQLAKFRRYVGLGYGSFWRGVIFDHHYKNLDDVIVKAKRFFFKFKDGVQFLAGQGQLKFVWPTGEELLLRAASDEKAYWDYHGQEFPFIGYNELTKYASGEFFDMMMSCNRSGFISAKNPIIHADGSKEYLPDIPLITFATTNPWGIGRAWVKKRWIDAAPPGVIVRKTTLVFNPRTRKEEEVTRTQVRIFGSYKENPYLDPAYIAGLMSMKNKNRRKAWLHGDWNVAAGGAIDDLWDETRHIVPRFAIPGNWYVDRGLDWGSTTPFSVQWYAEANGEEVDVKMADGEVRKWAPPAGTLFIIFEWYGSKEIGTNKGLLLSSTKVAEHVKKIDNALLAQGWIKSPVRGGPADNQIGSTLDTDNETIAAKMAKKGVAWTASDKSSGSRVSGLELFRDRLEASLGGEGPGFYVMRNCQAFIEIVPNLPRDEVDLDDVQKGGEDHNWDNTRYRVLDKRKTMSTGKLMSRSGRR